MNITSLPSGWKKVTLGEISEKVMYGINAKAVEFDGNKKYVRISDIDENNKFNPDPLTSPDGTPDERFKLLKGDLLIARTGATVGKSYLHHKSDGDVYFAGYLIRFRIVDANPEFVFLQTQTPFYWNWVKSVSMRSGQPGINAEEYKKLPIILPKLEIQETIVEFLNQWNTTIEKTKALIDTKERQFRWLQNRLFRNSFDKWKIEPLKNLSIIKKGQQLNRNTLNCSGAHPVWNGGITPSGYTDKSNTSANTITISEGGNSCGFVNYCKEDFWLGGHCYALQKLDSKIDSNFLYFYLKVNERRIMKLRVGSGLPNIQKKDIVKVLIQFPDLVEQRRIANLLNKAKQEIDLLTELANQYSLQKNGLMQKLLSGEWNIRKKEAV